jgi:hypothetical protein
MNVDLFDCTRYQRTRLAWMFVPRDSFYPVNAILTTIMASNSHLPVTSRTLSLPKGFRAHAHTTLRLPNHETMNDGITFRCRARIYSGPSVVRSVHWNRSRGVHFVDPETLPMLRLLRMGHAGLYCENRWDTVLMYVYDPLQPATGKLGLNWLYSKRSNAFNPQRADILSESC